MRVGVDLPDSNGTIEIGTAVNNETGEEKIVVLLKNSDFKGQKVYAYLSVKRAREVSKRMAEFANRASVHNQVNRAMGFLKTPKTEKEAKQ